MILNPFIIISPQTSPSRHHPKGLTDTDLTQRPLGRQHRRDHLLARLLAGGGVHVEILEEHLGRIGRIQQPGLHYKKKTQVLLKNSVCPLTLFNMI